MSYEYAVISPDEVKELSALEDRLSSEGKKVVLLAVEAKFGIADLTAEELEKVRALERELSTEGREMALVAMSR